MQSKNTDRVRSGASPEGHNKKPSRELASEDPSEAG